MKFFPTIGTTVINLTGKSSIGKTTALRVAASLWGNNKFIKQWRVTDNALEGVASYHNDSLLILDELSQIDAKKARDIIYMLGNEQGKGRMRSDATLRESKRWRISILSSGEVGIADKIEEEGKKAKGGILVRCIDIDAQVSEEFGIFNILHNFPSGAEFSNYLKVQATEYHGVAAEAFVEHLSKEDPETIKKLYDDARQRLFKEFELQDADCQTLRIAEMFALYLMAGFLASADRYGVFTHNPEGIESAIFAVFKRLLEDRGGKKSCEEQEIVQYIIDFLMQHEASFKKSQNGISEILPETRVILKCFGYVEKRLNEVIYYVFPTVFKEDICKKYSFKTVRKILSKKDMLDTDKDGKDKKAIFDGKRARMTTIIVNTKDGVD